MVILSNSNVVACFLLDCNLFLKGGDPMWIYSPYITKKGVRIYASSYGKQAFRFWVDTKKKKQK